MEKDSRLTTLHNTALKFSEKDFSTKINLQDNTDETASLASVINTLGEKYEAALASEKKLEVRLQQSEEQQRLFTSIINFSDDAIISKNLEGIITTWNNGAEKIFGYAADEIIGKDISVLIPVPLQKEEADIMQKIKSGLKVHRYETKRLKKDGTIIHVSLIIAPVKDAGGNITGASKISRDITGRIKAEEHLRKSVQEVSAYKYALDESAIVAITDQKGIIKHVNENFCKISRYSADELIGQDHRIVNSGYHPKEFIRQLWVTIANGKIWRGELRNKAKDGTIYWVDTTIVPFLNETGKPYQYLAIRADITERKKAEGKLEDSIKEISDYKTAIDESAIVAITDQKGIIKHVNENFCKISRYSADELIGQDHRIVNSGYHPKEFIRQLWVTIANGKIWLGELRNKAKDGTIYWVDTTIVPFLNETGKPYQYLAIRADITERKKAEGKLEDSIKEISDYKTAIDESAIVAITDQKGIIKHVNENFCKISRYSADELIGQDHRIINSGYHPKEFIRQLWVTIANGKIWRGELRNKAKDGTIYWVDTTIVPFLSETGKPYQYLAIRADITERKKAEEELVKTNRLYAFLSAINKSIAHTTDELTLLSSAANIAMGIGKFESARIGLLDEAGRLNMIDTNTPPSEGQVLLRYSGTDFSSHLLRDTPTGKVLATGRHAISNDAQNDPGLSPWKKEMQETGINSCASFPIKKFGRVVGVFSFLSGKKNFFDEKEIALLHESVVDISFALEVFDKDKLRKAAETEVILLNATLEARIAERTTQLQYANKELESFSYSVAHDLRSPLRGIHGYAAILKEDYTTVLDEEGKRLLGEVEYNAKRMGMLIDELLTFSKIGRKEVVKAPVDMNVVFSNSLSEIEKGQPHNAKVSIAKLHPVLADAALMKHVVINLLTNAIKYSSKNPVAVIEIRSDLKDENVIYSVKDNGVGFDMEFAGKLFGVFQRLHSDDEFEGTGVGLAIAHRIVQKHDGKIWANSQEGSGATFYFSLPCLKNTP